MTYSFAQIENRLKAILTPQQYASFCTSRTLINRFARVSYSCETKHRYACGVAHLLANMIGSYLNQGHAFYATRMALERLETMARDICTCEHNTVWHVSGMTIYLNLK